MFCAQHAIRLPYRARGQPKQSYAFQTVSSSCWDRQGERQQRGSGLKAGAQWVVQVERYVQPMINLYRVD